MVKSIGKPNKKLLFVIKFSELVEAKL